ncbi:MAG: hypothetical protein ACQETD_05405 [Pseudomonadota bacterium]
MSDYYGNYSPHLPVQLGSNYTVSPQTSGRRLEQDGTALQCHTLSVVNRLPIGALDMHLLRTGRIVASKSALAPGQKALFTPTSSISVASCYGVAEGAFIARKNLVGIRQFYNLNAIASADIVMAGGGCATDSVAIQFHLENVVTY